MFTVEECVHLLTCGLVSELYIPAPYLHDPYVDEALRYHMWFVVPSMQEGWVVVRRRILFQD